MQNHLDHLKKIKTLRFSMLLCAIITSCSFDRDSEQFKIQERYSATDGDNVYEVILKEKDDTVRLSYNFVLNNGELIDSGIDSLEVAGLFSRKDVFKNKVKFKVRDYIKDLPNVGEHDETNLVYDLQLEFLTNNRIEWTINSNKYGILPRLPNHMIFKHP